MSRLLLDTHVALWALAAPGRLSEVTRRALVDQDNSVVVSVVSVWEVAVKHALGRIDVSAGEFATGVEETGFVLLDVTRADAVAVGDLPMIHRDPFERMLVAQARCDGWTLVTRDDVLPRYGVPCLPA